MVAVTHLALLGVKVQETAFWGYTKDKRVRLRALFCMLGIQVHVFSRYDNNVNFERIGLFCNSVCFEQIGLYDNDMYFERIGLHGNGVYLGRIGL